MVKYSHGRRCGAPKFIAIIAAFVVSGGAYVADTGTAEAVQCDRTITANVVVFDSPTVFNRLGAQNPNFINYALRRDVVNRTTGVPCSVTGSNCTAGNVELRPDKRPRPLVLRSAAEACLTVNFTNLLAPGANPNNNQQFNDLNGNGIQDAGEPGDNLINNDQVADRCASLHASGTEVVGSIDSDGSLVGKNPGATGSGAAAACGPNTVKGGLVGPGASITYNLYTPKEGTFVINSYGATVGSEANGGNLGLGMFGQLNVQPKGAKMYRGQLTEEEMRLATVGTVPSDCTGAVDEVSGVTCNPGGQPIIDYEATYPSVAPWTTEGKAGLPIINMLAGGPNCTACELVHSDINAIIAGPNDDGSFPPETYPLESVVNNNPA